MGLWSSFIRKSWLFSLIIGLILVAFGFKLSSAHAESSNDCHNAVVWCGVSSLNQLINDYNSGDGHNSASSIQNIYAYFGISTSDIDNLGSSTEPVEMGHVTSANNVYNSQGQLIATNAITGGRSNIAGSSAVRSGSTSFFVRPPSVSFVSSPLSAYVVLKDGRFAFAILSSCGNAVKATPVMTPTPPKPAPKPTPTPTPKPKPATPPPTTTTPVNICSGGTTTVTGTTVASQVGGNCNSNTTVIQTQVNAPPQMLPAAQCTSLGVSVDPNNPLNVSATVNYQVENGAELSTALFNFGDGTTAPPSTQTTVSHIYAQSGSYVITATLNFTGSVAMTPVSCQASLFIGTTPPPVAPTTPTVTPSATVTTAAAPTPTPPSNLVNTGPGDVVSLFGTSVILSSLGYRSFLKWRLSKLGNY